MTSAEGVHLLEIGVLYLLPPILGLALWFAVLVTMIRTTARVIGRRRTAGTRAT